MPISKEVVEAIASGDASVTFEGWRAVRALLFDMDEERSRLRELCACAYRAMDAQSAPSPWLYALSSASAGNGFDTDGLLADIQPRMARTKARAFVEHRRGEELRRLSL
jgi:hypothetical protein